MKGALSLPKPYAALFFFFCFLAIYDLTTLLSANRRSLLRTLLTSLAHFSRLLCTL